MMFYTVIHTEVQFYVALTSSQLKKTTNGNQNRNVITPKNQSKQISGPPWAPKACFLPPWAPLAAAWGGPGPGATWPMGPWAPGLMGPGVSRIHNMYRKVR